MRLLPAPEGREDQPPERQVTELRFEDASSVGTEAMPFTRGPRGIEMICTGIADGDLERLQIGDEVRLYTWPSFPGSWTCGATHWFLAGDSNCDVQRYGDLPMFCTPSAKECSNHHDGPTRGMVSGSMKRTRRPELCPPPVKGAATYVGLPVPTSRRAASPPPVAIAVSRRDPPTESDVAPRQPPVPEPPPGNDCTENPATERLDRPRYTGKPGLRILGEAVPLPKLNRDDAVGGYVQIGEVLVGRAPRAVAVGDINGDGRLDLVVARSGDFTLVAVLAGRDGRPHPTSMLELPWSACALTIGEFEGDASADVAVAHCSTAEEPDNAWIVLVGDGKGRFEPGASSQQPLTLNIVDLNNDGADDIVALSPDGTVQDYFVSDMEVP
jgi:hypothetical protein